MKLYYSKGACSLAIRIIIHELGLNCEYEAVDLKSKKTEQGKDFLTINPKGSVPALETADKQILTENSVIQQYLADTHHATNLLPPASDFKRYRVLEWLNFVSTDLHKACTPLFYPVVPDETKERIFKPLLKHKLKFVNQEIGEQNYLINNNFTLPDAYLFVVLTWMAKLGIQLEEFSQLNRYLNNLKQRTSIAAALQEEH